MLKTLVKRIFPTVESRKPIIIVSGLPRCGTSMMMQMLNAGGVNVITDRIRKADEDNPKGYFEFEKVKKIQEDTTWLSACKGKAFKMVSALLFYLPGKYKYKIIFMKRKMNEMIASQNKMLERQGQTIENIDEEILAEKYKKHLDKIEKWMQAQRNVETIFISFNETISEPLKTAEKVNSFLEGILDTKKMEFIVEKKLHRQKG